MTEHTKQQNPKGAQIFEKWYTTDIGQYKVDITCHMKWKHNCQMRSHSREKFEMNITSRVERVSYAEPNPATIGTRWSRQHSLLINFFQGTYILLMFQPPSNRTWQSVENTWYCTYPRPFLSWPR